MFGTALFSYGIAASNGSNIGVALSLFAAIFFTAVFSNGHINPAVSTGFLIKDKELREKKDELGNLVYDESGQVVLER